MAEKRCYIVAYDIVDNRLRNKVSNTLKDYGVRIQKSVFECRLGPEACAAMTSRLAELINPAEDSILIYPLCKACAAMKTGLGQFCSNEEREFREL